MFVFSFLLTFSIEKIKSESFCLIKKVVINFPSSSLNGRVLKLKFFSSFKSSNCKTFAAVIAVFCFTSSDDLSNSSLFLSACASAYLKSIGGLIAMYFVIFKVLSLFSKSAKNIVAIAPKEVPITYFSDGS